MHNPLVLHSEQLLDALIKAGHRFFIRQTYPRGINPAEPNQKGYYLISHYDDEAKAKIHLAALKNDRYGFMYYLSNIEHEQKLRTASNQPAGYKIYAPLLMKEWQANALIEERMRAYIEHDLKWRPGRGEKVFANLFLQYGELFVTLKFDKNRVRVPLADIEKINQCATTSPFHLQLN